MKELFDRAVKNASWTVLYLVVCCFGFMIVGGVIYAILVSLIGPDKAVWADVRCAVGLPLQTDKTCIQASIDQAVSGAVARQKRVQARIEDELLAAKRSREAAEQALADQNVEFIEGQSHSSKTIIVGLVYRGGDASAGILRGWCWAIQDRGGLDPRVMLERMDGSGLRMPGGIDQAQLQAFGWTQSDVVAARAKCPWP